MILKAIIDDRVYELNVPDALIAQGGDYFDRLDRDMDAGWQMSREWVEQPDRLQRCQIVGDRLLTALETENEKMGLLMAGYLLSRLPGVETVELDVQGEIQNNAFTFGEDPAAASAPLPRGSGAAMGKLEAMAQAGSDVTTVFKVGRGYRFSVFDHAAGVWSDSPLASTKDEAERLRQQAFKARYEELLVGGTGPGR